MGPDRAALVDRLRQRLLTDAGAGGWGYYTGKSSRIEPTCWALLALGSAWDGPVSTWTDFALPHLGFLGARQGADGLLVETEPALANFTANGLAAIALTQFPTLAPRQATSRVHDGLVGVGGVRMNVKNPKQNNQLQGWPWVRDTFSWVEPTAWCLLAMKKADAALTGRATAARVQEAEKLLVDRVCMTGGWNYGNASSMGQDLRAYVPTTAIGLLAMQDRRGERAVQQSVTFLVQERLSERSASALSLTAICLRVCDLPTNDVEEQLVEAVRRSEQSGYLQAMAMAVYALTMDQHDAEAFRVRS